MFDRVNAPLALEVENISEKLHIPMNNVFLYMDSSIVLRYLRNTDKCFTRYVTRRVELILRCFHPSNWFHVQTEDNCYHLRHNNRSF